MQRLTCESVHLYRKNLPFTRTSSDLCRLIRCFGQLKLDFYQLQKKDRMIHTSYDKWFTESCLSLNPEFNFPSRNQIIHVNHVLLRNILQVMKVCSLLFNRQ